jgi:outer membrane protein assembly factor BamB
VLLLLLMGMVVAASADVRGWLNWRGPQQDGTSRETGLPDTWTLGGTNDLWHIDISGGGTPVIANGRLFALGYRGQGADLQEVLFCANAETGKVLWEHGFNDYLSDITYERYAIGSPCIDPQSGNVYALTCTGIFSCYTPDGKLVWQHPMMEEFGRLTFTNGRNGGPIVEDDLVIVRGITSNWGGEGAAMDRLYAFDKKTGLLVWSCSPGAPPKDNSFARPYFVWRNSKRLFFTGTGDGSIICANARTGDVLWRYPVSAGGFNSSIIAHGDTVIGIHADENLDSSEIGRMVAVKMDAQPKPSETGPPLLDRSAEAWRNRLASISSSPVLVGDRLYEVVKTGVLCCVDANTGEVLWRHKLGPDELHASPLYADGKLYVPLRNGSFYILRPGDKDAEELCKVSLEGNCIGAPAAWNGKVYVFTTGKLYCFGKKGANPGLPPPVAAEPHPKPGKTVALQILPAEVLVHPGEKVAFTIRGVDANGFPTETFDSRKAKWSKYIPPTARVRSEMNADFTPQGEMVASSDVKPSAGAFEADIDGLKGHIRGRVLPALPLHEDFESFDINVPHATETGVKFAYPPLPWIGARFKFEVRDVDGNKVLAKTLDNIFFQRALVFIGTPDAKNYTAEADVMADGNSRTMSTVGLINQRYLIMLDGNAQEILVSSNQERLRASVPFKWQPHTWYHLKTQVNVSADGSGVIRAKAWQKGDPEPSLWNIEVPHKHAHTNGAPGLFGFAPQSLFRVYIDNISVTPNR